METMIQFMRAEILKLADKIEHLTKIIEELKEKEECSQEKTATKSTED